MVQNGSKKQENIIINNKHEKNVSLFKVEPQFEKRRSSFPHYEPSIMGGVAQCPLYFFLNAQLSTQAWEKSLVDCGNRQTGAFRFAFI